MELNHKKEQPSEIPVFPSLEAFEFIEKISQSPFGEVWSVKSDSKLLTLKKISKLKIQKIKTQFIRELKRWYKISHKNLVQIFGYFEDCDFLYILMEMIEGIPLSKRIQSETKLDRQSTVEILTQVIEVVDFLHSLHPPIIYKYVRPENIMIDMDGNVKMSDFCWASINGSSDGSNTLEYLAPETVTGADFGVGVDIWCIGVLAYEMCLSRSPFKKSGNSSVLSDIKECNVVIPEICDNSLKNFVLKILVKDPEKRMSLEDMKKDCFLNIRFNEKKLLRLTIEHLQTEIKAQSIKSTSIISKLENIEEEISELNKHSNKLQNSISAKEEEAKSYSKSIKEIKDDLAELDNQQQDLSDTQATSDFLYESKLKYLQAYYELLEVKASSLSFIQSLKNFRLESLSSNLSSVQESLALLNEKYKSLQSPSLMYAKALVFSSPLEEIESFNSLCSSVNSEFSKTCESSLTRIQDLNNLIFLKERYICELAILYQEKQKELLEGYNEVKNELELKLKRNLQETQKLHKTRAEEFLMKKVEKTEEFQVDLSELIDSREKIKELTVKRNDIQQKIKNAKREIIKLKIKKENKNKDLEGLFSLLSNLAEAMLKAKVELKAFSVRRIC